MKVNRADPPEVRAGKWAERWEWAGFRGSLNAAEYSRLAAECEGDEDGSDNTFFWMREHEERVEAECNRARALLWRREVEHIAALKTAENDGWDMGFEAAGSAGYDAGFFDGSSEDE